MKENRDLHRMFSQSAMDVWYFKSATISRFDFTRGRGRGENSRFVSRQRNVNEEPRDGNTVAGEVK